MREFDDLYLDELIGFAGRKRKKSKNPNKRVAASEESPLTGIHFPEGSKRIAFEVWVKCEGNYSQTIRKIKEAKIFGGRAPSMRTIRMWSQQGRWDVLRDMLNDGLQDFLDGTKDPSIKDAIRTDATYFSVLLKMRSSLVGEMLTPRSGLWPKKPNEALGLMKHLGDEIDVYKRRAGGSVEDGKGGRESREESPDNVLNFLREREKRGNNAPLTESQLAMDMLEDERQRQQQQG